ncbi:MAG: DUF3619 family protein [Paucibacter sp.]|nr:DUF3619 family protein [Roseateles sp.]
MNKLSLQELDTRMARFGMAVAGTLSEQSEELPHSVTERLRAAREQAMDRARATRRQQTVPVAVEATGAVRSGRSLALLGGPSRWFKLASVLPPLLLVAGLLLIQHSQWYEQVLAAAEIDTALLSDKLPPSAYSDPGFSEYLSDEENQ